MAEKKEVKSKEPYVERKPKKWVRNPKFKENVHEEKKEE